MIKDFAEIDSLTSQMPPLRLVALSADEREFLLTLKIACERGYITPVIVGGGEKLKRTADEITLDLSQIEIIETKDPQAIADTGISMFFNGDVDIAMKGHIPTAFVYRSIIRQEKAIGRKGNIAVNTFWDIPGAGHLVTITDTGVSIRPDLQTKREIIRDAVDLMHLFGYPRPRVLVLSAQSLSDESPRSLQDALALREDAARGRLGECEVLPATTLWGAMAPRDEIDEEPFRVDTGKTPHIFVVPHLDAGNILSKLDFILDVTRRSIVMTSKGPVIIPSRSDIHPTLVGEVALGAVVTHLRKGALR
jgi:phosphate butyryltransferase